MDMNALVIGQDIQVHGKAARVVAILEAGDHQLENGDTLQLAARVVHVAFIATRGAHKGQPGYRTHTLTNADLEG